MKNTTYDLLIIGGGINGTGIAVDAMGRGLSVMLCEQGDLASATSWKSTKLIHGGLRYLEYYEFRLVHEALKEREILLRKAPHIIHPLLFIMPYHKKMRPAWLIRLGLFLYDHLSRRHRLPSSKRIKLRKNPIGAALKKEFKLGFSYADCYADDARLVVLNALQAHNLGAQILTRTRVVTAKRHAKYWDVVLENTVTHEQNTVKARVLVNATGPWVEQTVHQLKVTTQHHMALDKGSHIVVPKFYDGNHAYILQNTDKRVIFVIPFVNQYALIGTTDVPYTGNPADVAISAEEIDYLLRAVNQYFAKTLTTEDIVWQYAGVRPLLQDDTNNPSAITRDYYLELNSENDAAPILNIFGGKITTYRKLAEAAMKILHPYFPHLGSAWTAEKPLPGGDVPDGSFPILLRDLRNKYLWLPTALLHRYAHQYGTLVYMLLSDATALHDLGKDLGAGLYQREVEYLVQHEWARTAEDILWRRTKLGLHFPESHLANLTSEIAKVMQHDKLG